ncbi:MAG: molecular chaperone DnaJ [Christensenellaceae bacterium]|nr:molecular chaperone DnaJ [Christensenellaceae bacterium]
MANKDYYQTLGVEKSASQDEIKKAYRQMAKKYHPDMNKDDESAAQKFKEVNEAYQILSDEEKRAKYDQFGSAAFDGSAGAGYGGGYGDFGGFGGFGDIFESFFGGGGRSARRQNGPMRGADVDVQVYLTFEEAAFGVKKEVTITRQENCETCGGSGAKPGSNVKTCTRCGGTGQIRQQQQSIFGNVINVVPCPDCRGEGKIVEEPCPDCRGTGRVNKQRTISVNIPAGIDDGQVLTLSGQGHAGVRGGSSGDVHVYVSVRPHKTFRREGVNLYMEMPISFGQAALGCELEVPTLDGKIKYSIPAGTQTGTTFRMKGKGVKYIRQERWGDLYVKMNVVIPRKLSEKQKELILELEDMEITKDNKKGKGVFRKL